jgi:hypothetical protein
VATLASGSRAVRAAGRGLLLPARPGDPRYARRLAADIDRRAAHGHTPALSAAPTRAFWLNQVEGCFSTLRGQPRSGSSLHRSCQLRKHIDACIAGDNASAEPFAWTKSLAALDHEPLRQGRPALHLALPARGGCRHAYSQSLRRCQR